MKSEEPTAAAGKCVTAFSAAIGDRERLDGDCRRAGDNPDKRPIRRYCGPPKRRIERLCELFAALGIKGSKSGDREALEERIEEGP